MTKLFGKHSEDLAVQYLIDQGFYILERNYKKFFGEIDIIARKASTIAFVEVKARKVDNGLMYELVDYRKQQKIGKVARLFISSLDNKFDNVVYRFDVLLISGVEGKEKITHIPNAYSLLEN